MFEIALEAATLIGGIAGAAQLGLWAHSLIKRAGISLKACGVIMLHISGSFILAVPTAITLVFLARGLPALVRLLRTLLLLRNPFATAKLREPLEILLEIVDWCKQNPTLATLAFVVSVILVQWLLVRSIPDFDAEAVQHYLALIGLPLIMDASAVALYLLAGAVLHLFDIDILSVWGCGNVAIATHYFVWLWFFGLALGAPPVKEVKAH